MEEFNTIFVDCTSKGTKIPKEEYLPEGKHIVIDQGQNVIAGYTNLEEGLFEDVPAIVFGDHTRIIKYIDKPFFLGADGAKLLKSKKEDANYKYLYYALKNARIPDTGYNRHFKWLKEVKIEYPDRAKQARVVEILDKLSNIIEHRRKEVESLDELIKARFVEMFGDQERNPFDFRKSTIGDSCNLKSGTSLPSDKENEGGNIPYVKVGDMNYPGNERYITTSSRYVSEETAGNGLFDIGTVIFPKRGGAIGTNKKRMTTLPICADLNVMGVSSKGDLLPEYLLAYFDDIDMGLLSDGSSVPQINNKNIAPLSVLIPPMELQKEFSCFIKQIDKSKAAVQKALDETQMLFNSLMQKYFG